MFCQIFKLFIKIFFTKRPTIDISKFLQIITKEINFLSDNLQEFRDIDGWSFSEENLNKQLKNLAKQLDNVRISKILFNGEFCELKEYIDFYKNSVNKIYIRENFNNQNFNEEKIKVIIKSFNKEYGSVVRFLSNHDCTNNLFLVGNEIRHGNKIIKKLERMI